MSETLHARYYADRAVQTPAPIVANQQLAEATWKVRFRAPEIARRVVPGQFLMLRIAGCNDPLIGRPLALYNVLPDDAGEPQDVEVVYLVAGKMTRRLANCQAGETLDVWGPLGNGFAPCQTEQVVMVAGGIGQTPFLAVAEESLGRRQFGDRSRVVAPAARVTLCYGARSAKYLAGVEDFERLGVDVRIATDDGTRGHHGLVTDLLEQVLAELAGQSLQVLCCGPEPMMEAVSRQTINADVPCQVSLETPMACGIGICFTCVARVRDAAGAWDYKRTCVEGPVFEAAQIAW